jgi:hypothetical protein
MMICLRQNEGEFPQAEISKLNKTSANKALNCFVRTCFYIKLFSSEARKYTFILPKANYHSAAGGLSFSRSEIIILPEGRIIIHAKRDINSP